MAGMAESRQVYRMPEATGGPTGRRGLFCFGYGPAAFFAERIEAGDSHPILIKLYEADLTDPWAEPGGLFKTRDIPPHQSGATSAARRLGMARKTVY
jgi:hypothetical protein